MTAEPRWSVVTGASSGIGRAAVLALAADGSNVVVHYRRSREAAEGVARDIRGIGREAFTVAADFEQPDAGERLVEEAWRRTDGVDFWFQNAGADTLTGEAARWSFERKFEVLARVDLWGGIAACRAVGARMKERGRGSVATIGWDQSATGMEGDSGELFAAIKGGVTAFTRSLAKSLAPAVRVNCVAPGWIRTAWGEGASPVWQERVMRETPLKRWGEPADVAAVVAFLASDRSSFLTGQVFNVNGGCVTS